MAHESSELAAFMQGETRLVYARFRAAPHDIYFLEDGTAARPDVRKLARHELECLVPGCDDPRLKVVNRRGGRRSRRDGFAHYSGAGAHHPMSVFHLQSQLMIERWLRMTAPEVVTELEGWTAGRKRRADVLAASPEGFRVAFEVQYSAEPAWRWQQRHDVYAENEITDAWLFSNTPRHFKLLGEEVGRQAVVFTGLQVSMLEAGQLPRWINPQDGTVATPYVCRTLPGTATTVRVLPSSKTDIAEVAVEELDASCTLDRRHGFLTPLLDDLLRNTAVYEAAQQDILEARPQTGVDRRVPARQASAASAPAYGLAAHRPPKPTRPSSLPVERIYRQRSPEEIAARRRCSYCGEPLPDWQEGGQHIPECERLAASLPAPSAIKADPTLFDL